MNSEKQEEDQDVPVGWELCTSKKNPNRKYFFNRKTGKSSWTRPQNEKSPSDNKCKKDKEEEKNTTTITREDNKKNLKRKSDGEMQNYSSKKTKEEKPTNPIINTPSPKKRASTGSIKESPKLVPKRLYPVDKNQNRPSPLQESPSPSPCPSKRANTSQESSECSKSKRKKNYKKNIATARLSQLRAELTADAQSEENQETTQTSTSQAENKAQKTESNTSLNESQTSTHSPNDNTQSNLPPSQFFAANKIIYSMKAQLPDRDTLKQKDTFADIEEGINNQTTEYPFMKHPVTPPQFSEASKLMSAIKSKLSYKSVKEPVETPVNVFKAAGSSVNSPAELHKGIYNIFKSTNTTLKPAESSVNTFKSARDRMDSLKMRLSSEAMDTQAESTTERSSTENMDVDARELNAQRAPVPDSKKWPEVKSPATASTKENVVLVVDTNIFIHELDFIKNIMNSRIEGYKEQPALLVPWRVVTELDALKDSNNGHGAICKRARPAMDYLYKALPDTDRIKVQPLRDANSHIYPCESPDDEILNCCLQQAERGKSVILLSNDKNLCTKAVANGVETKQLRALVLKPHTHPSAAPLSAARLQKHIYTLLSNILENEMRAKYDQLWLHVVFKAPPWSLADVLQCLLKHWVAVFNEVFPRIEYLIVDLRNTNARIEARGPNNLTLSDVSNFKDLCLEVAKRCQIIPEYMELAKQTVENLQKDCASESEDDATETAVIDAFEKIWTVYSSYTAKLCCALGVAHSVEDRLGGAESLPALAGKLAAAGNQVATLAAAMEGVLNVSPSTSEFPDRVSRLESAFGQSLRELGLPAAPSALQQFCTKCRSMLEEARGKFTELARLLTTCKATLES